MFEYFKDKTILIIGGTGTVGKKITDIIFSYNPAVIRIFSRDEYKQFVMQNEYGDNKKLRFFIGDIRDLDRVRRASQGVDIIFHLAAMKHVPASEYNPYEAVKTNVIGTQNVINSAIENNVSRVVFTSSDKAISPTNAMGATKLLAERLISAADYNKGNSKTIFTAVRFGNVMGSRGSVIPLFKKQILEQKRITVTNHGMSRFMMSITEAANLTIEAVISAKGGEIFVLKMPVIKLSDLAEVVTEETCKKYNLAMNDIQVVNIGLRPGEKMYEELMTEDEAETAYELQHMYAVTPQFHEKNYDLLYGSYNKAVRKSYSSHDVLPICKDEVRRILLEDDLI
jgi:FlaA1/EpsC-like NDP-sugar epimerase